MGPDKFLEPIELPDAIPSLIENPIIMPSVDQELIEFIRESLETIDKSYPFLLLKPGLLITRRKINGHEAAILFYVGYLPNVIS